MYRHHHTVEGEAVSEMAIVDTFTKLIFGENDAYSSRESLIIEAFREVDANVYRDNHLEMGEYLRSLGVREMVHLVSRLKEHVNQPSFSPGASALAHIGGSRLEH